MNADTNAKLVQNALQLIGRGDLPAFLAMLSSDVSWRIPNMPNVPFTGEWRGPEQVKEFFHIVAKAQDVIEFEADEYIAQHDKVVVLGHFVNRMKRSGKFARSKWVQVWTVEAGKLRAMQEYMDTRAVDEAYSNAE